MDISDILGGVAEEHGILSSQCARVQAAASKLKGQTKLPKILQFNAHRARFFVATILSDEGAYGPVLVKRIDGNISGLNKGRAMERLSLALGQDTLFQVVDDAGQPKNGVNELISSS
jgi:hypothetical protein